MNQVIHMLATVSFFAIWGVGIHLFFKFKNKNNGGSND